MKKIIFSHGLESSPYGNKINALSKIAESFGYQIHSIDYQKLSTYLNNF